MYISPEFQAAAEAERVWMNQKLLNQTAQRFEELVAIFQDATRLEIDFWQMGLNDAQ